MTDEEDLSPLFLFDDEPVRSHHEDALQLKGFSRTIAAAAIGAPGPFTIGVFAGWGQGKTSILRQARTLIDRAPNQQHAVTAWVNAWRFEQEEHPIVPIILSILDGISAKLRTKSPTKPNEKFLANAHRALRAIIYAFGFRGKIADPLTGSEVELSASAKDMIERYEKLAPVPDSLVEKSLYYHAYEILDGILDEKPFKKPPYPKIVIFIDDLDRCMPDKALKVLESIKLILSQRGFVFVLAVDRDVIDAFLTKRYRRDFGLAERLHHGEQYMDKIIQLALHIPHHEGRFEDYIKNLIAAEGAKEPSIQGKQLKVAERTIFASLVGPLAAGTDRNPRNLIRILNRLLTDKFLWDQLPKDHKNGRPITNADELLRYAAVTRILENTIGVSLTRTLVRNQDICHGLAGFLEDFSWERPFPSAKDRPIVGSRQTTEIEREIVLKIETSTAVREMLLSDIGMVWLSGQEKRQDVEGFLDSTRAQTEATGALDLIRNASQLEKEGKLDEAETFYKRALAAAPNDANHLLKFTIFLDQVRKNPDAADLYFRRCNKVAPNDPIILASYGEFLIGRQAFQNGVNRLRSAWEHHRAVGVAELAEFAFSLRLGSVLSKAEELVWERVFKHCIQLDFGRNGWKLDAMLAQAEKFLKPEVVKYAKALAEAFTGENKVAELEKFPRWKKLEPIDPELVNADGTLLEE